MDGRRAPSPVTPGASDDEGWNHDCFSQIASPLTPAVLAPSGRAAPGWGRIEPLGEGVPAVEVERGASFTLGRQRSNTVRTRDRRASGQHFTIRWEQDEDLAPGFRRVGGHPPGFQLQDHSHNGTWLRRGAQRWLLRGTRIALQSGDVISLVRSYACPTHGAACDGRQGGAVGACAVAAGEGSALLPMLFLCGPASPPPARAAPADEAAPACLAPGGDSAADECAGGTVLGGDGAPRLAAAAARESPAEPAPPSLHY